ncbi:hypothetical protein C2S51_033349 [Perilla frutescens var. frutescens]|nr:hypothetical protein C2S51_033349 [Perilla frutescens var. frutescens]
MPPMGGFSFDLCRRNEMLVDKGLKQPSYLKTGTTIVGLIFEGYQLPQALALLKSHLFRRVFILSYQGHVQAALVLGGVDVSGPHLQFYILYIRMVLPTHFLLPQWALAPSLLWLFLNLNIRDEGIKWVAEAICSGIFNDLGSGSNVDGKREYLRNYLLPNPRTYVNEKGYSFSKKTEVLLMKIKPLRELDEVVEGGDMMEE